jgi:uncharacterized membrane protein YagU involved in acid resistance
MHTAIFDTDVIRTDVHTKLARAIAGGFLGTLVFSVMGKFGAPIMIGHPMDIAALMAPVLGGSYMAGVIAHFVTGSIVFPVAYMLTFLHWAPGPAAIRGVIFGLCAYLGAMIVVIPALGHGLFFGSAPTAMAALIAHIVFGAILGGVTGKPEETH